MSIGFLARKLNLRRKRLKNLRGLLLLPDLKNQKKLRSQLLLPKFKERKKKNFHPLKSNQADLKNPQEMMNTAAK